MKYEISVKFFIFVVTAIFLDSKYKKRNPLKSPCQ